MDDSYYAGSASDQAYEGAPGYTADSNNPPPHNAPHAVHSGQGTAAQWQQDLAVSSTHGTSLTHPLAGFDYPVYPPQAHFSHTDDSTDFLAHPTHALPDTTSSFDAHTSSDTWLSMHQHQAQPGTASHTQHPSEYHHPLPTDSHHHVAIGTLPVKIEARSQSPVATVPLVPSTSYSPPTTSVAADEATTAGASENLQHDSARSRGSKGRLHSDYSASGSLQASDSSSSDSDEGSVSTATGPAETSSSKDEIDSLLRDNPPRQRSDGVKKKNARFEIPPERKIDTIDRIITETDPSNKALLKELKQQKRLLRNRQAALDSRSRKKEHTRKVEEECKYLRIKMTEMDEELARYRQEQKQRTAERVQWQRKIDQILAQKEELKRMHAMETAALRQRCILLEADLQRRSSSTHHIQH